MPRPIATFPLPDEQATDRLAEALAPRLGPGDTLLLSGPIGAGKSHFARHLIRTRLGRNTDVPSPTYTLVQTYEDPAADIWHCDLYRLGSPDEALELGLDEAFGTALCLIEWPDRLGELIPTGALTLAFDPGQEIHEVTLSGADPWPARLEGLDA